MGTVYLFPKRRDRKPRKPPTGRGRNYNSTVPLATNAEFAFSTSGERLRPKTSQIAQAADFDTLSDLESWQRTRPSM
jgi:hypothetical protein